MQRWEKVAQALRHCNSSDSYHKQKVFNNITLKHFSPYNDAAKNIYNCVPHCIRYYLLVK